MQPGFEPLLVKPTKHSKLGLFIGTAALIVFSGTVGCVYGPPPAAGYAESPPAYVNSGVVVQEDYVYYPRYEVYYSNYRHQYLYRDGRSWVSRPAPPHVSAEVLLSSPSVRLDFHDHPSSHHEMVARQYPRQWAPSGQGHGQNYDRSY